MKNLYTLITILLVVLIVSIAGVFGFVKYNETELKKEELKHSLEVNKKENKGVSNEEKKRKMIITIK